MRAVVIGTGPAGLTAAATLRRLDPTGSVTALSAEPFPPYSPAALADHLLTGRDQTLYWQGTDVAERLGVDERRSTTVTGIDLDHGEVVVADGPRIPYDGLVVASGSRLYAPLEGADRPGVLDFKSLQTATDLIGSVRRGDARSALVVGNGFIGIELALLLADLGVEVTIIDRRRWVMPRVLDPITSAVAEAALVARGVTLRLGIQADAFVGDPTVTGVRLADGTQLHADLVVAATGVKPHTEFLTGCDIATGWGVSVDDELRTSACDVVAAGDVAEAADWLTGERFVHAIFPKRRGPGQAGGRKPARRPPPLRRGRGDEQPQTPRRPHRSDRHDGGRRSGAALTARQLPAVDLPARRKHHRRPTRRQHSRRGRLPVPHAAQSGRIPIR
jgi:NAD(P)H-nitrite reductase large subunit